MKLWIGLFALAGAWAMDVKTDAAPGVNLAKYRTYAWRSGTESPSLLDARVHQAVDKQLATKGWQETKDQPDVVIPYRMREKPRTTRMTSGGGGRWGGGGIRTTKSVLWRMIGTDSGSSAIDVESEKNIGKMMEKAFSKFPVSRAGE
ncbi:MAG: DUF4136 domain-containing protein [Acidobacteria bacterium]|nr:DUF4136 domain-containing protein [Acidobacteriota bacterium]